MSVLYLAIVCNVYFLQSAFAQKLPRLPCPGIFHYVQHNEPGYHPIKGVIQFRSQLPIDLTVKIIIPALLRSTYNGRFEIMGSKNELQQKFDTEREPTFRFNLIYPVDLPIPRIKLIKLNGLHLCSHALPQIIGTVVTYAYTVKREIRAQTAGGDKTRVQYQWKGTSDGLRGQHNPIIFQSPSSDPPLNLNEACGKAISVNPLIVGGLPAGRGQWPWLVALYVSKGTGLEFKCGATLISNQLLVTAAHCVAYNVTHTRRGVKAYIGKYDLSNWEEPGSHLSDISDVYVHPDYQSYPEFRSDIAVLKLRQPVVPSRFAVPVCLWFIDEHQSSDSADSDSEGIVVGWGRETPKGSITNVPKMITLPIVSKEECLESSADLRFFATNTTLCAGKRNGSGPCSGDSGSGLLTRKTDKNGNVRWFLRGIVSLSLQKFLNKTPTCDLWNYIVFTDVLKFRDWLSKYVRPTL